MQRAKTHFEQIPVEMVKRIAEEEFPGKKVIRNDSVILKIPAKKPPRSSKCRSICKGDQNRKDLAELGFPDFDLKGLEQNPVLDVVPVF